MKSLLKICLLVILQFFTKVQAQPIKLDSLHAALKNAPDDTVRMLTYGNLFSYYAESNRDSAMVFVDKLQNIAKKIDQPIWEALALTYKSYLLQKQANLSQSIKLCNQAMSILQDVKNKKNVFVPTDHEFVSHPEKFAKSTLMHVFHQLGNTWSLVGNKGKAIEYFQKEIQLSKELNGKSGLVTSNMNIGSIYAELDQQDSAFLYLKRALKNAYAGGWKAYEGFILDGLGKLFLKRGLLDSAKYYFYMAVKSSKAQNNLAGESGSNNSLAGLFEKQGLTDSMFYFAAEALRIAYKLNSARAITISSSQVAKAWKLRGNADSAYRYLALSKNIGDSLSKNYTDKLTQFQNTNFEEQLRLEKAAQESIATKNKIRTIALLTGLVLLSILAIVFYRNNRQKQKANKVLETTLTELKSTQSQLIQSEKMASLGELTAGIAHEIQNPLNFVNNFSELNVELSKELGDMVRTLPATTASGVAVEMTGLIDDISSNSEKINHHGKRASDIVKGMLQHSRTSTGQKEPTDINALCDEYLRLAYHGLRAKDKTFNAEFKTDFDPNLPKVNVVPQDMGRVVLNIINNAFFAVAKQSEIFNLKSEKYEPRVIVRTKLSPRDGELVSQSESQKKIVIEIEDNGGGIPNEIKEKIFQPFFTTKPTGQGTGLGLSLAYDIVTKVHGGKLNVESEPEKGTIFSIILPF